MKDKAVIFSAALRIVLLLLCGFFVTFCYTTLHEGGHALAALFSGGSIRQINVNFFDLSAHALLDGSFTPAQNALIAAAGWGLPVLLYMVFAAFSRAAHNPVTLMLRWISGISLLGTILPWIILPIIYLGGNPPPDDVTSFLNHSGFPPLAVSAVFLVLFAAGAGYLISSRTQLSEIRDWLNSTAPVFAVPGVRTALVMMALITAVLAGILVTVNRGFSGTPPPAGYQQVAEMDLSQAQPGGTVAYTFEKSDEGPLGVFLRAEKIQTDHIEVTLRGPDGWSFPILQARGYSAAEDISNPSWGTLPAGTYELVITGTPAKGVITLFLKK